MKWKYFLVFTAMIATDQFVKWFVSWRFPELVTINYNGVFGVLPAWVAIFGLIGLVGIVVFSRWFHPSLVLVLAGGVSNIIDRLIYNGVVDFVSLWQFPVFNLADVFISLGAIWLVVNELGFFRK
jgi:lipoprotein signal peptidase